MITLMYSWGSIIRFKKNIYKKLYLFPMGWAMLKLFPQISDQYLKNNQSLVTWNEILIFYQTV